MGLVVTFSLRFPEPPAQRDPEGAVWGFASWPHSSGALSLTTGHAHLRVSGSQSTQQPGAAPTSLLTNHPFPTSSDPFSWTYRFCLGDFWSYSTQKEKAVFLTFPRSPLPPSPTSCLPMCCALSLPLGGWGQGGRPLREGLESRQSSPCL